MTDSMKKFLELASGNEALAAKLNGASKDEIIALAKEAGFILTEADFEAPRNVEISDDELDAVAGGKKCTCILGGGGACGCIGYGQGNMKDGKMRCQCPLAGSGYDNPC